MIEQQTVDMYYYCIQYIVTLMIFKTKNIESLIDFKIKKNSYKLHIIKISLNLNKIMSFYSFSNQAN